MISTIAGYMEALGWEPYQCDREDANGQFELNWGYADAKTTCDRHVFFKYMVKTFAEKRGLIATFIPKPFSHITGSGGGVLKQAKTVHACCAFQKLGALSAV